MIHNRRGVTGQSGYGYVEVWRDGIDTVLVVTPARFDELVGVVTENSRWRLLKAAAIAKRQKRETE